MKMRKVNEAVAGEWVFRAKCCRCGCVCVNVDFDRKDRPRMFADLDGAPFLSYYCERCAIVITEPEAKALADQARKDIKSTHIA